MGARACGSRSRTRVNGARRVRSRTAACDRKMEVTERWKQSIGNGAARLLVTERWKRSLGSQELER